MTEKDLINFGFQREHVSARESGSTAFYYYHLTSCGMDLISCANDELKDGEWVVQILENDEIRITNKWWLSILLKLLDKNRVN